jgi:hypothetical protein
MLDDEANLHCGSSYKVYFFSALQKGMCSSGKEKKHRTPDGLRVMANARARVETTPQQA